MERRISSFDDLMYFPTTLGMQMSPHSEATYLEPQGLCVSLHPLPCLFKLAVVALVLMGSIRTL